MNVISDCLRKLSARLPIPEPARSRVLLEIATDMEDLFQHHQDRGASSEEAVRIVEEQFDLSDEVLRELVQLHSSPLQRSLDGISRQAQSRWERGVLALVALFVIPGLAMLLLQPSLLRDASPLAYGLLGILVLGLGLGLWQGWVLFGKKGRTYGPRPLPGLDALPVLAILLLGLGFAGVWMELFRAALVIRGSPERALVHLLNWLQMASATLVIALSGALLTGLIWFFLESRTAHLEEEAAAFILEPTA